MWDRFCQCRDQQKDIASQTYGRKFPNFESKSLKLEIRLHACHVFTNTQSGTEVSWVCSTDWLMHLELGFFACSLISGVICIWKNIKIISIVASRRNYNHHLERWWDATGERSNCSPIRHRQHEDCLIISSLWMRRQWNTQIHDCALFPSVG